MGTAPVTLIVCGGWIRSRLLRPFRPHSALYLLSRCLLEHEEHYKNNDELEERDCKVDQHFFLIYRGFPWLCFPVMMLCQLLFMILSQLSARCELQRSYDFRAGSKSSPSDSLRAFGRAGWWAPVRTVRICVGFRARVICNVKPGSTSIAAALNRSTCSGSYKITAWAGEADWSRGRRRRCVLWPCKSEWICKPWLKEETGEEAAAFCRAEGWVSRDGSRQREQHRIGEQQTHTHFWFKGNLLCFYLFPFIHMHS